MQTDLIIKLQDGLPVDHPMLISNFQQAFPDIDINNLPDNFAFFKRNPMPRIGIYEKDPICTYELVDGLYQDVWQSVPLTPEEKLEKQNKVKAEWQENGYPSWVWNEEGCGFVAPVPHPADGKYYYWDEPSLSWIEDTQTE